MWACVTYNLYKLPAIYMIAELRTHPKLFQTGHVFSFCTHDRCNGGTLASSTPSIMFFMSLLALARIQLWCYRQCCDIESANISHNILSKWILIQHSSTLQAIDLNVSLNSSFICVRLFLAKGDNIFVLQYSTLSFLKAWPQHCSSNHRRLDRPPRPWVSHPCHLDKKYSRTKINHWRGMTRTEYKLHNIFASLRQVWETALLEDNIDNNYIRNYAKLALPMQRHW